MSTANWAEQARQLSSALGLKHAPIAITFAQQPPQNVTYFEEGMPAASADGRTGRVAAGCVFWIKAADKTFATAPEDHFNCSVGSVTHGLKKLDEVMDKQDVGELLDSGWVTPAEAMSLPVIQDRPDTIIYGPLANTPHNPDVVLLRLNAFQAMVIHDAYGDMPIVGKPQCHIIPMAKENGQIAMSTGCMLSRVRTGMGPDELTCAIPAARLSEVIGKLAARQTANAAVASYASADMQRFQ